MNMAGRCFDISTWSRQYLDSITVCNSKLFYFQTFFETLNWYSAPPSKNAVSAILDFVQTSFFYLERLLSKLADDQCSCIKGSIFNIKHINRTFYYSSWLTWNWMFNGSIFNVLYLQILRFYLVRQYHTLSIRKSEIADHT